MRVLITLCCYLYIVGHCYGSTISGDNTPPVIVTPASDLIVDCKTSYFDSLLMWHANFGGIVATDNDSLAGYGATVATSDLVNAFLDSQNGPCVNDGALTVGYFALDTCGTSSVDTSYATFTVVDIERPVIITPAQDVLLSCDPMIVQNIQNWIDSLGGATAIDSCSSVVWNEYIWADNQGNNGFAQFNNQHEIPIDRTSCDWYIDVSFFARDECGNRQPSIARLSILDTIAPNFIEIPQDITVTCDAIPAVDSLIVTDYCDGIIKYFPDEFDSKSNNPQSCEYYNYLIERIWRVSDACGNMLSHTQVIEVIDTTGPIIQFMPTITIGCDTDTSDYEQFITIVDQCASPFEVEFSDSIISEGCNATFERTYIVSDICGNSSSAIQQISTADNEQPEIVEAPQSLNIYCDSTIEFNEIIAQWVDSLGYAIVQDACQNVEGFVAEIGSFMIVDPATYPGVEPTLDGADFCQVREEGLMYTKNVAFVFSDNCGNIIQSIKSINVFDTIAPVIMNCPSSLQIPLVDADCSVLTTIAIPEYQDNCLSSQDIMTSSISLPIISDNPGSQTSIVAPLVFNFVDINPNYLGSGNSELTIKLNRIDGNGLQEYFDIIIEGSSYGQTPQMENECDNANMTISGITANTMLAWLDDGIITIEVIPNNTPGSQSNTVNDICTGSSITLEWTTPVENQNNARIFYLVDDQDQVETTSLDSITVELEEGVHRIEFFIEDCGGNVSSCSSEVVVIDNVPPIISCPSDTVIYVNTLCQSEYVLSTNFIYTDNCISAGQVSQSQPAQGPGFLSFQFDQSTELFIANDRQYQFSIPNASERVLENPQLKVDFAGSTVSAIPNIIDESGKLLLELSEQLFSSCDETSSITLDLEAESFDSWVEDDKVLFVFQANQLTPCGQLEEGLDNFSKLKLTLSYSDIQPDYSITGDTLINGSISDLLNPPSHTLPIGTYVIEYSVFDATGNVGICDFGLSVIDTIPPVVECMNSIVELPIDGVAPYLLDGEMLVLNESDNCTLAEYSTVPTQIDCSQLGTTVSVLTTVTDASGNESQCESLIQVVVQNISPSFSVGICQGDALQLNANVPIGNDSNVLSFAWSGPSGYVSTDQNPTISNPTELNTGTYIVEVIGLNGCSTSSTVDVVINQFQDPVLVLADTQYCIGDDVVLMTTNFGVGITYTWFEGITPNLIELAQTADPILQLSPQEGGHFYSVVVSNSDCISNSSNVIEIEVSEKPSASIASPFLSVCEGDDVQLESDSEISGQNIFTWTGPNGYTGTGPLPQTILNVSTINEGNYILQIDNNGCLSNTATVQVIVFDRPTTPIISGENVLCEGGNFNISAQNISAADQFTWVLNGVLFSTTNTSDLTITNANGSLSGEWQCYIEENLCNSDTSQVFVVSVESSLQVGVSNDGPVCVGDMVQLNATFIPGAAYTWTSPSGSIVNGQKPEVLAEEGEYVLNIITNAGCSIDESTFVHVTNPPVITAISNTAPNCEDDDQSITFTPTVFPVGQYEYTWTGPNDFMSNLENPAIPNATTMQNGVYTLVVSIDGCDSESQTTIVDIDNTPFQPTIISVVNTCEDQILQLSTDVQSTGSTIYTWNTPNGIFQTTSNLYFSTNIGTQNSGLYSVSIEDQNCSSIESNPILVEIVAVPPLPEIDVPNLICQGESATLMVIQPLAGLSYTWTTPSGNQFVGSTLVINDAGVSDIGGYTVQVSNGSCANNEVVSANLFVRSLPSPPILVSSDTTICLGSMEGYEFCISEDIFFNYDSIIIVDQGLDSMLFNANTPCSLIDLSYSNGETIFLGVIGFNQSCSSEVSEIIQLKFEVETQTPISFVEDSILLCDDDLDLILLNLSDDVDSFSVIVNNGVDLTIDTMFATIMLDTVFDNTQVVVSSYAEYCGLIGNDTLHYIIDDDFQLTDDIITIDEVGEIVLDILSNDALPEAYTTSIVNQAMSIDIEFQNGNAEVTIPIDVIGSDQFEYQVCSDYCPTHCDTATVILIIGDETNCIVSNMLTPNNDGYNDTFRIPCLDSGSYPDHELIIFNRWGDQVFVAAPYDNDWTAEYDGESLPSGTYFYILDLNDGNQPLHGFIAVER